MKLGDPVRTYEVEPLDDPVPREEPVERPQEPAVAPAEPESVPA